MKYACPCCGCLTLDAPPPGTYDICSVCFWEDDPGQYHDTELLYGANPVCLREARENFIQFGACEKGMLPYVRSAYLEELQ